MSDPTTMSDEELEAILASVAGDAPVVPPKTETPPKPEPEPALSDEELSKIASGEIIADDDTVEEAIAAIAEKPVEPTVDDVEAALAELEEAPATKASDEVEAIVEAAIGEEPKVEVVPEAEIPPEVAAVLEDIAGTPPEVIKGADRVLEVKHVETPEVTTAPVEEPKEAEPAPSGEKKVVGVTYYIDPARLARDVAINVTDLDSALMTHASNFVHYAVQAANARRQFERMKAAFEILESKLDNKWRTILKEENPKTTEAQIRAAVVGDKDWSAANVRMIEARTIYELAQDAKEAFTMRRDTLLQLAKDAREERLGQLRVQAESDLRGRVDEKLRAAG